jgi:hypothetical protein
MTRHLKGLFIFFTGEHHNSNHHHNNNNNKKKKKEINPGKISTHIAVVMD